VARGGSDTRGRAAPSAPARPPLPPEPALSIYRKALGRRFAELHPRIQRRFGIASSDRVAQIGRGRMDEIWHGAPYTLPFLAVGTWRRIMFPARGGDVPFTIENYAYVDGFGRETVTWMRTFDFRRRSRRFDAYMVWSARRNCIVDYLGSHQHLAVDIHLDVDPETHGLRLRSGAQRFYERRVAFAFPMALSGFADAHEWFDDETDRFRISVDVRKPRWGRLFGYRGSFAVEEVDAVEVPRSVRPRREEVRE
jgi:hypothetical protein